MIKIYALDNILDSKDKGYKSLKIIFAMHGKINLCNEFYSTLIIFKIEFN